MGLQRKQVKCAILWYARLLLKSVLFVVSISLFIFTINGIQTTTVEPAYIESEGDHGKKIDI